MIQHKNILQRLLKSYHILLITILIAIIGGQGYTYISIRHLENEGHRINLAGRQRMISAQIVKYKLLNDLSSQYEGRKDTLIKRFIQNHEYLFGSEINKSDLLPTTLQESYSQMNRMRIRFLNVLEDPESRNTVAIHDEFIRQMDLLVYGMDKILSDEIRKINRNTLFFTLFTVLVLLIEYFFIFSRAYHRIIAQEAFLKNIRHQDSHVIRKPIANALQLTDILEKVNSSPEENTEIISALKNELLSLDDIIRKRNSGQ